ncbi:uncharacterized protein B0T23DRAFT_404454 [Neurospora hispaniola]|uniref:Uncharacterized protein n=1 Tax=Neurospora hispaniola TaxID=588809 RepID=A0AAJ0I7S3_9PEZI|nr:hypothetical protein B0T23DRAFT_404454 [Neurospora hispaniola]
MQKQYVSRATDLTCIPFVANISFGFGRDEGAMRTLAQEERDDGWGQCLVPSKHCPNR